MTSLISYFDTIEIGLCKRINVYSKLAALRTFFAIVSKLGDGYYWAFIAVLCLYSDPTGGPALIARAAATAAAGIALYRLLKCKLVRERPYIADIGIVCGAAPLDRYSFPSGHTLHAVSFTVLFSAWEPAFLWITAPFALLVAVSRVVLGLHYPSDVLAGAAIGASLATVSNLV